MATNFKPTVYFIDGFSPRMGVIGVVSYLHELKNSQSEHTRFYTINNSKWGHREIDSQIVSLTYTSDGPAWWLLGKRGDITTIRPSGTTTETIASAGTGQGKLGYLDKIAEIDKDLYLCGYRRQVYRRHNGIWESMANKILAEDKDVGIGFTSIDGTSADNIYAVGRQGEIYHFNGRRWVNADSPTNVNLRCVRCVTPNLIYACGNDGVIIRGDGKSWNVIQDSNFTRNLWGMEIFQEELYVASSYGLAKLRGGSLEQITTGYQKPTNGYRLHAADGLLWSIGSNEILYFDGKTWSEMICPDNQ